MLRLFSCFLIGALMLAGQSLPAAAQCCIGEDDGPLGAIGSDRLRITPHLGVEITLDAGPKSLGVDSNGVPTVDGGNGNDLVGQDPLYTMSMQTDFPPGSTQLSASMTTAFDVVAQTIDQPSLRSAKVVIIAHTDASGSEADNERLSTLRAQAIADYLVLTAHVDPARLVPWGMGETQLKNSTDPLALENRRVDFVLVR